ncbi:hypothetical protein GQ600_23795 [Phytophthora cactorum]|nr:hypothetical protein GQ600_23795 [Phytophthora cactorum]
MSLGVKSRHVSDHEQREKWRSSNTEEKEEDGAQEKEASSSLSDPAAKRRQEKRRTVFDVDAEELDYVPAFKAQHDTWADLETCLQEYMESTRQKIVIKEVINTDRRNANLRAQVRY